MFASHRSVCHSQMPLAKWPLLKYPAFPHTHIMAYITQAVWLIVSILLCTVHGLAFKACHHCIDYELKSLQSSIESIDPPIKVLCAMYYSQGWCWLLATDLLYCCHLLVQRGRLNNAGVVCWVVIDDSVDLGSLRALEMLMLQKSTFSVTFSCHLELIMYHQYVIIWIYEVSSICCEYWLHL